MTWQDYAQLVQKNADVLVVLKEYRLKIIDVRENLRRIDGALTHADNLLAEGYCLNEGKYYQEENLKSLFRRLKILREKIGDIKMENEKLVYHHDKLLREYLKLLEECLIDYNATADGQVYPYINYSNLNCVIAARNITIELQNC